MINLNPIKKEKNSDLVIEVLLDLLRNGELKDGDPLPSESELSLRFGVSKPIIRESLSKMQGMGLLKIQNGKRAVIQRNFLNNTIKHAIRMYNISDSEILDIIEVRQTIESRIAEIAAIAATKSDMNRLKETLTDMKTYLHNNEEFYKYDMQFHLIIAEICRNSIYLTLIKTLQEIMEDSFTFLITLDDSQERALAYHQQIYEYIALKDPQNAKKAMLQHFSNTKEGYLKWANKKKK